MELFNYKAKVERVIDGDTIEMTIDLGFTIYWKSPCRLFGINTPELHAKDATVRLKAVEAKKALIDKLPVGTEVVIHSVELDKYGRPLVDIYLGDEHINDWMISNNFAIKYNP